MLKMEFFPTLRRLIPFAPLSDEPVAPHRGLEIVERYWNDLRRGRSMPSRSDIDPADIVPQLPFIGLVDVIEGGCDFRFRLLGTALDYAFGDYYTGWRLSEVEREDLRRIFSAAFLPPARDGKPYRRSGLLSISDKEHVRFDLVALPLSSDDAQADMLFLCWAFTPISADGLPS